MRSHDRFVLGVPAPARATCTRGAAAIMLGGSSQDRIIFYGVDAKRLAGPVAGADRTLEWLGSGRVGSRSGSGPAPPNIPRQLAEGVHHVVRQATAVNSRSVRRCRLLARCARPYHRDALGEARQT